jgi:hypothetical protein
MSVAERIGHVVEMQGRMIGMKYQPLHIGRGEMKDPGFAMIDPNNGMIVMRAHVQTP